MRHSILLPAFVAVALLVSEVVHTRQTGVAIPDTPLTFGAFSAQFRGDGTFSLAGEGWWPSMRGTWTVNGSELMRRVFFAIGTK